MQPYLKKYTSVDVLHVSSQHTYVIRIVIEDIDLVPLSSLQCQPRRVIRSTKIPVTNSVIALAFFQCNFYLIQVNKRQPIINETIIKPCYDIHWKNSFMKMFFLIDSFYFSMSS